MNFWKHAALQTWNSTARLTIFFIIVGVILLIPLIIMVSILGSILLHWYTIVDSQAATKVYFISKSQKKITNLLITIVVRVDGSAN